MVNSIIINFWHILAGGAAIQCGLRYCVLQNTHKVETANNAAEVGKSIIRPGAAMAISTPVILYSAFVRKIGFSAKSGRRLEKCFLYTRAFAHHIETHILR